MTALRTIVLPERRPISGSCTFCLLPQIPAVVNEAFNDVLKFVSEVCCGVGAEVAGDDKSLASVGSSDHIYSTTIIFFGFNFLDMRRSLILSASQRISLII